MKISEKFSNETPFFTVICTEKHNRFTFYSDNEISSQKETRRLTAGEKIIFYEIINARID